MEIQAAGIALGAVGVGFHAGLPDCRESSSRSAFASSSWLESSGHRHLVVPGIHCRSTWYLRLRWWRLEVLTGVGSVIRGLVVTSDTRFGRAITLTCVWSALSLGSAAGASLGGVILDSAVMQRLV